MRKTSKSIITTALFGGLAATALTGNVWAGPNVARSAGIDAPSLTDQIYYRRYRGGYYRRGYNPGAAAAAAAVGVLGAAAAAGAAGAYAQPYYYGYPAYGYPAYGYPDGYGW